MVQKSFEHEMLEALDQWNKSIETFGMGMDEFGRAFNEGMDKFEDQADDLLKLTKLMTMPEFLKGLGMKDCDIRRLREKIGKIDKTKN